MANIRWREKDIEELRKEIERYNRKLKRLEKKGVESDIFQPSLPFKEVKTNITTRAQYKDYLSHLRNLTEKGSEKKYEPAAEKGIAISKGEVAELDRLVKIINSDRRKRAKEYEKRTGNKVKNLPKQDIQRMSLKPKKTATQQIASIDYGGSMNRMNFKKFVESVQSQSDAEKIENRYAQYKANYIEHLPRHLAPEDVEEIVSRLDEIPDKDFYYLSINNEVFTVNYLYDPATAEEKAEQIISTLDEIDLSDIDTEMNE